ncbi:DNA binding domain, excisionase family [Agrobacterium sp. DSM 25558]|uniref:helix-turn-helix transcriptional regulator n=1 Tax=Agrobacterium sp. DSM 25558 TaxID=1907665 RepID=UPI0009724C2D|nr:helix-turn-helix domain-containing protein [Agrobacterium sp. DSM 25558]SCX29417.1 DNA binding domain, excisionase family [Agrobacterium sp. DSM 25558]
MTQALQTEMIVGAKQIAAATGLSSRRIYALAEQGKLPVLKIGATLAIRRAALADWIAGLEQAATGTAH